MKAKDKLKLKRFFSGKRSSRGIEKLIRASALKNIKSVKITDKQRIDWLDRKHSDFKEMPGYQGRYVNQIEFMTEFSNLTLRQAIDAAMRSELKCKKSGK